MIVTARRRRRLIVQGAAGPLTAGVATATPGDTTVTLSATSPVGGTAPYSYQWYRSTSNGVKGSAIAGATSRFHTDTGRTNATTYYYTLTATDSAAASVDYTQVSATPEQEEVPATVYLVTLTPATASVDEGDTVDLTVALTGDGSPVQDTVTLASSSAAATVPASVVTDVSGQATVTVTGVSEGSATITATYGSVSDTTVVTVNDVADPVGSVTGLSANVTGRVVTLSWTDATGATSYTVARDGATLDTVSQGVQTYVDDLDGGGGGGEEPLPEGIPEPQPGDTVRLDTRTTLQSATNFTQAIAAVDGADNTGERGTLNTSDGWTFNQNFDGSGTDALVANLVRYRQDDGNPDGDQGIHFIHYLDSPKPTRLYVQWKSRLGKHPSDSNANGTNNDFPLFPESNSCKRFLMLRDGVGGGDQDRWDYVWTRANPTQLRAQIDHQNWSAENSGGWSAVDHKAETYVTTVYMQAASTNAAEDGIVRVWINDTLEFERTDVPAQAHGFDRFQLPSVYHDVPRTCAEYFWDFLAWEPA